MGPAAAPSLHRRTLLTALLVAAAAGGIAADVHAQSPKPASASEVAQGVQGFYERTKRYRASFKQSYLAKVQNIKKVSTGKVAFAKPGKISFRYDNGNRVVSDGKVIKIYERDAKRMYRTQVNKSQYPAALSFMLGDGALTRDFTLRLLDPNRLKVKNGWVLEAVPKRSTPAYRKLLLYIDRATHQVRRVLVLDAQGNRNRFDFSSPKINVTIDKKEFAFTPPKGTTIITP